ncbi:MAG: homoserine kinase [Pseudomonadota bacterium]
MAVFTKVSDADVGKHLAQYGLPEPDAVTGIEEGTENTNYKVMSGGTRYILTLFEGRTAVEDLPYFLALMDHTAEQGIPAARPIRTETGDRLTVLAGLPAALISFLPGRPDLEPSYEDAANAGVLLGRFHQSSENFPLSRPNTMGLASWRDMVRTLGDNLEALETGLTDEITTTFKTIKERWPSELKRGTIHGDFFPDNILLDHGEPSGLIDFYFACTDFLAYDLAIAMNAYMPEDGSVDISKAEALFEGYQSVRPLSRHEQEAMPILLCGSALRFFLSRAVDQFDPSQSSVYTPKDPMPWLQFMRHHRRQMKAPV